MDLEFEQQLARVADEMRVVEVTLQAEIAKVQWQFHVDETEMSRSIADLFESAGRLHDGHGSLDLLRYQLGRAKELNDKKATTPIVVQEFTIQEKARDEIMVCPCCSGIPTFRQGCESCGSAWTKPEMLIHHYACAYIGSEDEFRQGDRFVCPKCRQSELVAGSDFETVPGGLICADCKSQSSQPELIGHCLSCQHRFPASEAVTVQLTGFHVHRVPDTAAPGSHPTDMSLSSRSCTAISQDGALVALVTDEDVMVSWRSNKPSDRRRMIPSPVFRCDPLSIRIFGQNVQGPVEQVILWV